MLENGGLLHGSKGAKVRIAAIGLVLGLGLLSATAPAHGQVAEPTQEVEIETGADVRAYTPADLVLPARHGSKAQEHAREPAGEERSGLQAFALNLLVPGLGQRYLNGGEWTGWGALYTGLDAALWLGLTGTLWHRSHLRQTYRALARARAGADLSGKDRPFFLQMAQHRSQEAFIDHLLRTRQWGQLSSAEEEARYWAWDGEEAWEEYRETRSRADALGRRRSTFIAGLVAHRLVTGLIALIDARGSETPSTSAQGVNLQLQAPPTSTASPQIRFTLRW